MEDAPLEIGVTANEKRFCDLVIEFRRSAPACPTKGDIRIAGGWVRDRLLGVTSHDLDVVLEDCTGEQFARGFENWLKDIKHMPGGIKIATIKLNPKKSKHLETAVMKIPELNLDVDFVNLRKEHYDSKSPCRIPDKIEIGTPHEDAFRRDLTINALFYNILTGEIEDWTEMGIDDLRQGIIRTPLDPLTTFLDDPLRIVRVVRFASKLPQMKCHESIHNVFSDSLTTPEASVHEALRSKVTRDRVRQELVKVFEYPTILPSLKLLTRWHLWGCVLEPLQSDFVAAAAAHLNSLRTLSALYLEEYYRLANLELAADFEHRGVATMAMVLYDLHKTEMKTSKFPYRYTAAQDCLMGLKSSYVSQQVDVCLAMAHKWNEVPQPVSYDDASSILRMSGSSLWWELSLHVAALQADFAAHILPLGTFAEILDAVLNQSAIWFPRVSQRIAAARSRLFDELQLTGIWDMKPALNGQAIIAILKEQLPQDRVPGTHIGALMDTQMQWIAQNWPAFRAGNPDLAPLRALLATKARHLLQNF